MAERGTSSVQFYCRTVCLPGTHRQWSVREHVVVQTEAGRTRLWLYAQTQSPWVTHVPLSRVQEQELTYGSTGNSRVKTQNRKRNLRDFMHENINCSYFEPFTFRKISLLYEDYKCSGCMVNFLPPIFHLKWTDYWASSSGPIFVEKFPHCIRNVRKAVLLYSPVPVVWSVSGALKLSWSTTLGSQSNVSLSSCSSTHAPYNSKSHE